jgi:hypothetical protein
MNLLAGGLAGAASLALVYPFEFATIRLAAELGPDAAHAAAAKAGAAAPPHTQLSRNSRVTRAGIGQLWHMVGGGTLCRAARAAQLAARLSARLSAPSRPCPHPPAALQVRAEGVASCYRGLTVSLAGMMAYKALFFGLWVAGAGLWLRPWLGCGSWAVARGCGAGL